MNDETEIRDNNHGEKKKSLRKYCSEVSRRIPCRGDDDKKKEEEKKDLKSQKRSIIQFLFSQ